METILNISSRYDCWDCFDAGARAPNPIRLRKRAQILAPAVVVLVLLATISPSDNLMKNAEAGRINIVLKLQISSALSSGGHNEGYASCVNAQQLSRLSSEVEVDEVTAA
jgi:hypothetical protein